MIEIVFCIIVFFYIPRSLYFKMKRMLVSLLAVIGRATDDYHTSDGELMEAKRRLFAPSDPNNPLNKGGIRARIEPQAVLMRELSDHFSQLRRGHNHVAKAFSEISPVFQGVANAYIASLQHIERIDKGLQKMKTDLDSRVSNFDRTYTSSLFKKIKGQPDAVDPVFAKYNQVVRNEWHELYKEMKRTNDTISKIGNGLLVSDKAYIYRTNKTFPIINKMMRKADFEFTKLLNRKALPLITYAKYDTISNMARNSRMNSEFLQQLKDDKLGGMYKDSDEYQKSVGEKLMLQAQQLVTRSATQIKRKLGQVRATLQQMGTKEAKYVNKNFTNIDKTLDTGAKQIKLKRKGDLEHLTQQMAEVVKMVSDFKTGVMATSADLYNTLIEADGQVTTIQREAKLGSDNLDTQFGSEIANLMTTVKNLGTGNPGAINKIQGSLSDVYDSATKAVDSGFATDMKGKIQAALSEASEAQAAMASHFTGVASDTRDRVNSELASAIGVANANLEGRQELVQGKATGFASDVQAELDEAQAESEDQQAGVISNFQKGIDQRAHLMSSLNSLNDRINQRSGELTKKQKETQSGIVEGVSKGRTALSDASESLSASQIQVSHLASEILPQIDKDAEAQIGSAFSQLNALRREGSSQGEVLTLHAEEAVNGMIQGATGQLIQNDGVNRADLSQGASGLKNATNAYRARMTRFEASMNADMDRIHTKFSDVSNSHDNRQIGQIVAHSQSALSNVGRGLIREIYKQTDLDPNTVAKAIASNPRFNVPKFLGHLLNHTAFDSRIDVLSEELKELGSDRATTREGTEEFVNFAVFLQQQITKRLFNDVPEDPKFNETISLRDAAVKEVSDLKSEMNRTLMKNFRAATESITNKTSNFYRQFQTASIMADSLVAGFGDYISKMIDVEKVSEAQREAQQDGLINSIQSHLSGAPVIKYKDAQEVERVNKLVKIAMDSSDKSTEGIKRRKEAADALVNQFGADVADTLKEKYAALSGNADALVASIEESKQGIVEDRVGGLEGSKMGLEGVNAKTKIFSNQASSLVEAQKTNAAALGAKIDELLKGNSFLTNITGQELETILQSVQNSDSLYASQMSGYKGSSSNQIATLGGVVESFATLVSTAIHETSDFLNELSKNYTSLIVRTDAITKKPVADVKDELVKTREQAENTNSTLQQHLLSIEPLEEGLQDRLASLNKQQDNFAADVHKQLNGFVSNIHKMDGEIATSRETGMRKLRSAFASLIDGFREKALDYQSKRVESTPSALIETQTDSEIKRDMRQRIQLVKHLLRG